MPFGFGDDKEDSPPIKNPLRDRDDLEEISK
jgi:hypothetical protein